MLTASSTTATDIEASFGSLVPPEVSESIAHHATGPLSLEKSDVWQLGCVILEMMSPLSSSLLSSCRYTPPKLDHLHADGIDDMVRLKQAVLASRAAMDNLMSLPSRLSTTYPLSLRQLVCDMLHPEPLRRPSCLQVHDQLHSILVTVS
jgi:serine/threonine protein kinase